MITMGFTEEFRRQAVDEMKEEVLAILGHVLAVAGRPPTVKFPPGRNNLEADDNRETARLMAEALAQGSVPALPLGGGWSIEWPTAEDEQFRRLLWLLGLSDAERAFVEAAAASAKEGRAADAVVDLAVFAEWLGDQLRHADAATIERLTPQTGDLLVISVPDDAGLMAVSKAYDEVGRPLKEALARMGRDVHLQATRAGYGMKIPGAEEMRAAGWVRVNESQPGRRELVNQLVGEPEDRRIVAGETAEMCLSRMIERLKRENAELRQAVPRAVAAEREACAKEAEGIAGYLTGDDEAFAGTMLRSVASQLRGRPPA